MIANLFPPAVVTVEATEAMWSGVVHPEEEALIRRAVPKRRREYAAGRLCAREALARFGIEDFPLLAGEDRVPRWPPGIVGSISHCDGYCGVAVARVGELLSVGLDVEEAEPLKGELLSRICRPSELAQIRRLPAPGSTDWAKVIFSAKESTYKCYYPLARTMLDFEDVEVELAPGAGSFSARLVRKSAPSARGVRLFHGRFSCNRTHVFTGVTLRASEASEGL